MRWEDEHFVKIYTRDTVNWLALSYDARCLFLQLVRKVDRAGILTLGRHGRRAVAVLLGAMDLWPSRLEPALRELEEDGCLQVEGDRLVIPNFSAAQQARQTDRARKAEQRERDRADAMSSGATASVTGLDIQAQNKRARSHDVTPAVTSGHTASHDVTLRRDETRREETRREETRGDPRAEAREAPTSPSPRQGLTMAPSPEPAPARHADGSLPFEAPPAAVREESLPDGLMRVHLEVKGKPYTWQPHRDDTAALALLARAKADGAGVPEVLQRWRHGLGAQYRQRCDTLRDLVQRWEANATPEHRAGTGPPSAHAADKARRAPSHGSTWAKSRTPHAVSIPNPDAPEEVPAP
ncbi:hypothetical protein JGU66_18620 [Myxococcaceae bacterium JPH2]|nr:hypothetical protein [Myxococcaceae bacterium JPH2]